MGDLYETDILVWSERQSALLRRLSNGEAVNAELDWSNIIEEIECVGQSERRAMRSQIAVVMLHLCKLLASPATQPRAKWVESILTARADVERLIEDSPSLRPLIPAMLESELPRARKLASQALAAYGETPLVDMDALSFTTEQVIGDWLPDAAP